MIGAVCPETGHAEGLLSPELNPIKNLWHDWKSYFWSNRAYPDYDALEQAAMTAWQKTVLNEDLLKTVCAAP